MCLGLELCEFCPHLRRLGSIIARNGNDARDVDSRIESAGKAFGALRGVQDIRTPLWIAIATNTLNLGLDWILIFGIGPFPRLELAGAAWASTVAQWLGAGAALYAVRRRLGLAPQIDWAEARRLLVVGSDLFVRTALLLVFVALAGRAAMRLGEDAGAAHALIRSIWMLTAFFLDAFAVVAQSLVGYFVGAARIDLARRVAGVCIGWSLATGVPAAVAMLAGTPWLLAALPALFARSFSLSSRSACCTCRSNPLMSIASLTVTRIASVK